MIKVYNLKIIAYQDLEIRLMKNDPRKFGGYNFNSWGAPE